MKLIQVTITVSAEDLGDADDVALDRLCEKLSEVLEDAADTVTERVHGINPSLTVTVKD
jgi:hypothetical protein